MEASRLLGSFADVAAYLHARGVYFSLDPGEDRLQCRFDDGRVSMPLAMRRLKSRGGHDWLALSIPICPGQAICPRAALVGSFELPVGSLALYETFILLRQTLPLATLSIAILELTMGALARTSALLLVTYTAASQDPGAELPFRYLFR
jgi:hypothetical protein